MAVILRAYHVLAPLKKQQCLRECLYLELSGKLVGWSVNLDVVGPTDSKSGLD